LYARFFCKAYSNILGTFKRNQQKILYPMLFVAYAQEKRKAAHTKTTKGYAQPYLRLRDTTSKAYSMRSLYPLQKKRHHAHTKTNKAYSMRS